MDFFTTIAVLIVLVALFGYVNSRFLRLVPAVGLMAQAFAVSLLLIALDLAGAPGLGCARSLLAGIDFNRLLFHGLLSFLLFAGALQIRLDALAAVRSQVLALSTVGVLGSTAIVGVVTHYLLRAAGIAVPLSYCLLFGALISPTDPIAVLPIIRRSAVPRRLEALISAESLFNDGFAVVVFAILFQLVAGQRSHSLPAETAILFARQAVAGSLFGLVLGYAAYRIVRTIDDYPIEIIITLALVVAGYAGAEALGLSGPLAMVVAGIVIGNHGRARGMSARTSENLDRFWEMIDITLNAILFVLIGFEAVALAAEFSLARLLVGLAAIPLVLFARLVSVGAPLLALNPRVRVGSQALPLLTWAGLRGAIPIALVLSLPAGPNRALLVAMTYIVVVFSILVQGPTVRFFVSSAERRQAERHAGPPTGAPDHPPSVDEERAADQPERPGRPGP